MRPGTAAPREGAAEPWSLRHRIPDALTPGSTFVKADSGQRRHAFCFSLSVSSEISTLVAARNAARDRIPNQVLMDIIVTRVFVRTGVNLRDIRSDQDSDSTIVAQILGVFQELGYPLSGDNHEHQNA